jgi:FPC/CPF motif-containing protein YcgG
MQPANPLQTAYDRAQLARHGISFERATSEPMFNMCLTRIAAAMDKPYAPPLPTHACKPHWQDKD